MRSSRRWLIILVSALGLALSAGCSRHPERTDAQVAGDVQDKIYSDSQIQSREISVQAANGVVTLSGDVTSDDERIAAANDAGGVEGVKTVINDLKVQSSRSSQRKQRGRQTTGTAAAPEKKAGSRNARQPENSSTSNLASNNVAAAPEKQAQPAEAQAQPPSPPAPPPPPRKVTVPAGTQLSVRLNESLDSERNQVGDTFRGSLSAPVVVDGETVIPSGTDVVGRVADVKSAGRFAGNSVLTLELTSLTYNGKIYNIQTNQWSREGKGEGKNTATKVGVGTAAGAILGGLIGGGRGAAIGAAGGAGAGTGAAAAKKGQQIKLAPEAVLNFQIISTLTVTPHDLNNRNAGRTPLS